MEEGTRGDEGGWLLWWSPKGVEKVEKRWEEMGKRWGRDGEGNGNECLKKSLAKFKGYCCLQVFGHFLLLRGMVKPRGGGR